MVRCDKHYRKFKLNAKYEDFEDVEEKKKEEDDNEGEQLEDGEQFANKGNDFHLRNSVNIGINLIL